MSQPEILWNILSENGSNPSPRAGHGLVYMDDALYTFGGQSSSGHECRNCINSVQRF